MIASTYVLCLSLTVILVHNVTCYTRGYFCMFGSNVRSSIKYFVKKDERRRTKTENGLRLMTDEGHQVM